MKVLMLRLALAFIVGLFVIPLLGWLYLSSGYVPVATASSPMPFEQHLANMALSARIRKEAPKSSPIEASEVNYEAGVHVYQQICALCHGLPGQSESATSKGMFPRPPQLFEGHGVTDDPAGETYWKVANGIRLTGMPAFTNSLSPKKMWQVSLLLANADKLSPQIRNALAQPLGAN